MQNQVRLLNLLALGQIALFLTTKLWLPPSDYPEVPLIGFCRQWPVAVSYLAFFGSLAGTFFAQTDADKRSRRIRHAVCSVSFALLFAMNQHRLQPWAWQFFILHSWLALAAHGDKLVGWRWLAITIYLYSAISKIDYAFCTDHGPFLWDGFLHALGWERGTARWNSEGRFLAAAMLPAAELAMAMGLCFRSTQRVGLFLSLIMHAGLLLSLGPWGHNHSAGVLIWNVFFIVQNVLLFPGPLRPDEFAWKSASDSSRFSCVRVSRTAGWCVLSLALIAPAGEPWGCWDHWPGWSIYSARSERVQVFVHEDEAARLPDTLAAYLHPSLPLEPWQPMRIDRWSLDAANVPIYPQTRFQLGVALAVAERYGLKSIRVVIHSAPNRWTGQRDSRNLDGLNAVRHQAKMYRLNALPQ